jgi:8-oxo-dGTP pyrophosphatase MutT (NUDIX family)
MYKVFIDNKPVIYKTNSEKELQKLFPDHRFIEAAGGIVERDKKFLFIKRNAFWDIPKGKLDKGETPEQGAVREIEEETGLKNPIIQKHLVNTWHTYGQKGQLYLKKTYWYLLEDAHPETVVVPQEEEGITEVRFFEKKEFGVITEQTYLSIVEVIDALGVKLSNGSCAPACS